MSDLSISVYSNAKRTYHLILWANFNLRLEIKGEFASGKYFVINDISDSDRKVPRLFKNTHLKHISVGPIKIHHQKGITIDHYVDQFTILEVKVTPIYDEFFDLFDFKVNQDWKSPEPSAPIRRYVFDHENKRIIKEGNPSIEMNPDLLKTKPVVTRNESGTSYRVSWPNEKFFIMFFTQPGEEWFAMTTSQGWQMNCTDNYHKTKVSAKVLMLVAFKIGEFFFSTEPDVETGEFVPLVMFGREELKISVDDINCDPNEIDFYSGSTSQQDKPCLQKEQINPRPLRQDKPCLLEEQIDSVRSHFEQVLNSNLIENEQIIFIRNKFTDKQLNMFKRVISDLPNDSDLFSEIEIVTTVSGGWCFGELIWHTDKKPVFNFMTRKHNENR
jgi:hypothetical protein